MSGIAIYPVEYHVCKNIVNFCKFRGLELDQKYELKTADGKVVVYNEPITFYATKDNVKYQIIYLPPYSVLYKKNHFMKIADQTCEIIVIKDSNKKIKYSEKQITEFPVEAFYRNHEKAWREKGQECKILTNDEVNNYLNIHKMMVESFPKLSPNSIEAIWYGLIEGHVVEITSSSISSAGLACTLRRVAKTSKIGTEPTFEGDYNEDE